MTHLNAKSMVATGQEMVMKKKILQGQGKVRKCYFESGKIAILKKSHGTLKVIYNTTDLIPLKPGRNISGLSDVFAK